jgi:disulfide bond formation protein DsbB
MVEITPRCSAGIAAFASIVTIASVWGFELIGGLAPCQLCLEQRWPHYITILLGLLAYVLISRNQIKLAALALGIIALIMIYSTGIAIYHAGVEWTFWPGPATCSGGDNLSTSAASLLHSLNEIQIPNCKDAAWRLLGISLAGYNVIISVLLFIVTALGCRASLSINTNDKNN